MKIIDYSNDYSENVKDLLCELEDYITSLDKEKYNIKGDNFREVYFNKTIEEVNTQNGKILLLEEDSKIIGLVAGIVNNEEIITYDFTAPKRGRITELIVSKNTRNHGYGKILLKAIEDYLHSIGCEKILIEVFAYNENAINFYDKNGYHTRVIDMID